MNKEEAIEILSEMRSEYNLFGDEEEATRYHVLSWAIKEMNGEPVKHGRWYDEPNYLGTSMTMYFCSYCGSASYREDPYCWHCGSKMDVSDTNIGKMEDENGID